jgi:hypothetical protein
MTLVEPGVVDTAVTTAPLESSVSAWPVASVAPPSTIFLKVARVPDDSGRRMSTIGSSGPPTSFQFRVLPVQMSVACWLVRPFTLVTSGLTTMIQPCLATMWSTRPVMFLDSAVTSELPIWTAPWLTCVRPVPEPPPWTWIWAAGQAAT